MRRRVKLKTDGGDSSPCEPPEVKGGGSPLSTGSTLRHREVDDLPGVISEDEGNLHGPSTRRTLAESEWHRSVAAHRQPSFEQLQCRLPTHVTVDDEG